MPAALFEEIGKAFNAVFDVAHQLAHAVLELQLHQGFGNFGLDAVALALQQVGRLDQRIRDIPEIGQTRLATGRRNCSMPSM